MRTYVLVALAAVACGPSASEVRTAKTAEYRADPSAIFQLAMQAAQQDYKIGEVDAGHLRFETVPRFYSSEGDLESEGAEGYVHLLNHSVRVSFIVAVTQTDNQQAAVTVVPHTLQVLAGSPEMRPIEPDDPSLPPWVHGRADALSVAIYQHARGYVAGPPGGS
jgi:hypothetical protein